MGAAAPQGLGHGAGDGSSLSRGSAIIEIVALGLIVGVALLTAIAGAARLLDAEARASGAADVAATAAALGSGADRARDLAILVAPDAESVSISSENGLITAVVTIRIPIIGPAGGPMSRVVTGRSFAVPGPHVSARG